jgi:hypothetical protein
MNIKMMMFVNTAQFIGLMVDNRVMTGCGMTGNNNPTFTGIEREPVLTHKRSKNKALYSR